MFTEQIKLETNEVVLRTVRKHWFILFIQTISLAFLAIFPIIFVGVAIGFASGSHFISDTHVLYRPAAFFSAAWLLIVWMIFFGTWTDYYLDLWTITDKRIIAINQKGFFNRSVASFRLERL